MRFGDTPDLPDLPKEPEKPSPQEGEQGTTASQGSRLTQTGEHTLSKYMPEPIDTLPMHGQDQESLPQEEPKETATDTVKQQQTIAPAAITPSRPNTSSGIQPMSAPAFRQIMEKCTFGVGVKMRVSPLLSMNVVSVLRQAAFEMSIDPKYVPWLLYEDQGKTKLAVAKDGNLIDTEPYKSHLLGEFQRAGFSIATVHEIDANIADLEDLAACYRKIPTYEEMIQVASPIDDIPLSQVLGQLSVTHAVSSVRCISDEAVLWERKSGHKYKTTDPRLVDAMGRRKSLRIHSTMVSPRPIDEMTAGIEGSITERLNEITSRGRGVVIFGGTSTTGKTVMAATIADAALGRKRAGCSVGVAVRHGTGEWMEAATVEDAATSAADVILWKTGEHDSLGKELARLNRLGKLVILSLSSPSIPETIDILYQSGASGVFVSQSVIGIFHCYLVPILCPDCSIHDGRESTINSLGIYSGVNIVAKQVGGGCPTCHGQGYIRLTQILESLIPDELVREVKQSLFNDQIALEAVNGINAKRRAWSQGITQLVLRGEADIDDLRRVVRPYTG